MVASIPTINLSGSYASMGEAFGEQFRQPTIELAQIKIDRIIRLAKQYTGKNISESQIIAIGKQLISVHQQYDLSLWQEFCGIAHGAGISLEKLLITSGYTDVLDYILQQLVSEQYSLNGGGCTAFILPNNLTKDNTIICGQTWDMFAEAQNYLVMVKRKPLDGPETLWLTTMGCLGLIGINQYGLACGTTNLVANNPKIGVHYLFTVSKALMQNNLIDAQQVIINTQRLAGHSFYLADQHRGVNLETTSSQIAQQKLFKQPIVQTNHYKDYNLASYQVVMQDNDLLNSGYRYSRALSLLCAKLNWSVQDCWHFLLADNQANQLGETICKPAQPLSTTDTVTAASILIDPHKKKLWVSAGSADRNSPQPCQL